VLNSMSPRDLDFLTLWFEKFAKALLIENSQQTTDAHAPANNKEHKPIKSNNLPHAGYKSLQQRYDNHISLWMLNEVDLRYRHIYIFKGLLPTLCPLKPDIYSPNQVLGRDELWLISATPKTRFIGPVPQTKNLLYLLLTEVSPTL